MTRVCIVAFAVLLAACSADATGPADAPEAQLARGSGGPPAPAVVGHLRHTEKKGSVVTTVTVSTPGGQFRWTQDGPKGQAVVTGSVVCVSTEQFKSFGGSVKKTGNVIVDTGKGGKGSLLLYSFAEVPTGDHFTLVGTPVGAFKPGCPDVLSKSISRLADAGNVVISVATEKKDKKKKKK